MLYVCTVTQISEVTVANIWCLLLLKCLSNMKRGLVALITWESCRCCTAAGGSIDQLIQKWGPLLLFAFVLKGLDHLNNNYLPFFFLLQLVMQRQNYLRYLVWELLNKTCGSVLLPEADLQFLWCSICQSFIQFVGNLSAFVRYTDGCVLILNSSSNSKVCLVSVDLSAEAVLNLSF